MCGMDVRNISGYEKKKLFYSAIIISISVSIILTVLPYSYAQRGSFIIEVTFIDSPRNGPNDVSIYVQEYPGYSRDNLDLIDAMYDDDPDSPDGQYTTRIAMPSGLIDTYEEFHICVIDENKGRLYTCYDMTNSPKKGPEYLTIRV